MLRLRVLGLAGGPPAAELELSAEDLAGAAATVARVRAQLGRALGAPVEELGLVHGHSVLEDGQSLRDIYDGSSGSDVLELYFVRRSRRLAVSGGADCSLFVWDLDHGRSTRELRGHSRTIECVAAGRPPGAGSAVQALSGGADCELLHWDIDAGTCIQKLGGHTRAVLCLAVDWDRQVAVSGSADTAIRIWDLARGHCQAVLRSHAGAVNCLAFDAAASAAISGSVEDHSLRIWDTQAGVCTKTLLGSAPKCVALHFADQRALSGEACGAVRVWDIAQLRCILVVKEHSHPVRCLQADWESNQVVTGSLDYTLRYYAGGDLEKGSSSQRFAQHESLVLCVAVDWHLHQAVSGDASGSLLLWDLEEGSCLGELTAHTHAVWCVALA